MPQIKPGQSFEEIAFRRFLGNLVNEQVPLGETFVGHRAGVGSEPLRMRRGLRDRLGLRTLVEGLKRDRKQINQATMQVWRGSQCFGIDGQGHSLRHTTAALKLTGAGA
jgi:hypothetical protein